MKKQFSMLIVLLMLSLGFMASEERVISGKLVPKEDSGRIRYDLLKCGRDGRT
jgi:hypothetical protein